ncbi:MAG: Na+:solute symporter [Flavobacteriales bacterium]|nr:Na+:solute symporter [Flavobacteriales bacterium]
MELAPVDWIIIASYLLMSLGIGLYYKNQASKSLSDFFLGGRKLPWYIAGISMVATTFAADTPLWVTEKVAQHGVSGNWLWWNMLIGGMLTTFFFAKLWRRAEIVTELEFVEIRYSGKPASFLRGFKSVYMGIFLNAIVIGWVNAALASILKVFFDIPDNQLIYYIAAAMLIVAFYATLSGLKGVAITDTVQFFIAMAGCIILAIVVLNTDKVGGISGLKAQLPAWRFDFFPKINSGEAVENIGTYSVTIGAFLTFSLVQWWASWYPGAEPGGGGYIAQRMMSAKDEKNAVFATLFFQIAHYCLRPWPWIIVGLCALVLYPDLPIEESGQGFVMAMKDYLPAGLKGLLLVAFLSAYMSTISTQLNWGASYLTNDLYKRFLKKTKEETEEEEQKDYVKKARLFTVLIMLVSLLATTQIKSIDSAATFLIECGAGLGLVLILRWYWWRINAWSEITASLAPFIGYSIANYGLELAYPVNFLFTVSFSTIAWLIATFVSAPTNREVLENFYRKVRPNGAWKPFQHKNEEKEAMLPLFICWASSIVMVYACLFFIGDLIFLNFEKAIFEAAIMVISLIILRIQLKKTRIFDI